MTEIPSLRYQDILASELEKRRSRNPRYSLRAFARDLETPVQHLSRVLNGQRGLSVASAVSISHLLGLSSELADLFVALVESKHARTKGQKERAIEKALRLEKTASFQLSNESEESEHIRWYHLPIYMLFRGPGSEVSTEVIARKIGIAATDASAAIESLVRRGLLEIDANGICHQKNPFVHVKAAKSTEAVRQVYSDVIAKAAHSVQGTPPEKRALTAGFLLLSETQIAQARERITQFSLELIKEFGEVEDPKSQIFAFATQLFPIEKQPQDQQ